MKVKTAKLAPHLRSLPQQVKLSGCTAALSFDTFVGTIAQNEKPAAANQACSVYRVEPNGFDTAVLHRLFPLCTMRATDKPVFEANDYVTRLVNHCFHANFSRSSRPKRDAQPNSATHRDWAVVCVPKAKSKTPIPLDMNHLGEFRNAIAVAGKSYPFSDLLLVFHSRSLLFNSIENPQAGFSTHPNDSNDAGDKAV
jgi:hypothetical protein